METHFSKKTETSPPEIRIELDKEGQMYLFKAIKWIKGIAYANTILLVLIILTVILDKGTNYSLVLFGILILGWPVFYILKHAKSAEKALMKSQAENEEGLDYTFELENSMKHLSKSAIVGMLQIMIISSLIAFMFGA